jgi:myosin heavy subunit
MSVTGFGNREQAAIFELVAAVLHLGNVRFKEIDERSGACKVGGATALAAELLGVDEEVLKRVLSVRHIKTAREELDVPNNSKQCAETRDALAKALYARMFDWVVLRLNKALAPSEEALEGKELPYSIGVVSFLSSGQSEGRVSAKLLTHFLLSVLLSVARVACCPTSA